MFTLLLAASGNAVLCNNLCCCSCDLNIEVCTRLADQMPCLHE